ncbi:rhodanese-like domain-containing protein [uncultured Sulfitobacter sp.]|uniref:rhodanese-like domain-containing protein n=1 Tax=uncultured Sulfitobacter sp. TaxID=191468 RepID=UPI002626F201|nr:rhodanese-like domain-containing protein [uncultured Sulfitobacter sp.]
MIKRAAFFAAALFVQAATVEAQDYSTTAQVAFNFGGTRIEIGPNASDAATYAGRFAALPASCDPYCIAPATAAVGIDTLIEGEVLDFLVTAVGENTGLLVDARMPDGRALGYIPGSVSLPHETMAAENEFRDEILKALGARAFEDVFNFVDAQNLVVFDNGPTQNDAGVLISHLLEVGYPPEKIRYYRGGMQVWSAVGLTVQE